MPYNKEKITARIIIVSCIVIIIVAGGWFLIKNVEREFAEHPLSFTDVMMEDYDLVKSKYRGRLKNEMQLQSDKKNPLMFLWYDSVYELITCKIDLAKDIPLSNLLRVSVKSVSQTNWVYYVPVKNGFYEFNYLRDKPTPTMEIYVTLAGDSLRQVAENDSIVSYHLRCKNLSVRYEKNGPRDIFMMGKEGLFGFNKVVPLDLLFLKRGSAVYFMVMVPPEDKGTITPDLLYNIVAGN